MQNNSLYFVFSSVTFLQLYIPIVIEGNKRKIKSNFILRKNGKSYADPYSHRKLVLDFCEKFNINLIESSMINEYQKGIYFVVDGDVYGPPKEEVIRQSLIFKIRKNKDSIIINLNEHMNFMDKYDIIQQYCDYCFFESKELINFWSNINEENFKERGMLPHHGNKFVKIYDSNKNIYGINTKFDNYSFSLKDICYNKFSLHSDDKYCLFLYPKLVSYSEDDILNIYSHLRKLGYKIIVKARPKSSHLLKNKNLKGDCYVESDIYPNETLMLLSICELCVFSSSSAQTECLFSMVPCLDLESETRQKWPGFEFLVDNKFYKQIINEEWKGIEFNRFKDIVDSLEKKGSQYIVNLRNQYFMTENSSSEILNRIILL